MIVRRGPLMGLLLCLAAAPVEARTHLDRQELKILSAASVAVVYVDTDTALEQGLDPAHHALGLTPLTAVLADVVNSYRLRTLLAHLGPYRSALDGLALPGAMHRGVQDALVSVPWLMQMPWIDVRQDPKDALFLTRQAKRTPAPVVVFIHPRLFLDPSVDALYLVCSIDIETAGPHREIAHYDSSVMVASEQVDDAELPEVAGRTGAPNDLADVRMAKLLANDGAAFKKLYARLMLRSQQQLHYYFTGDPSLPPATADRVGQ